MPVTTGRLVAQWGSVLGADVLAAAGEEGLASEEQHRSQPPWAVRSSDVRRAIAAVALTGAGGSLRPSAAFRAAVGPPRRPFSAGRIEIQQNERNRAPGEGVPSLSLCPSCGSPPDLRRFRDGHTSRNRACRLSDPQEGRSATRRTPTPTTPPVAPQFRRCGNEGLIQFGGHRSREVHGVHADAGGGPRRSDAAPIPLHDGQQPRAEDRAPDAGAS